MVCRKKMWLRLSLWFALVYIDYIDGKHATESLKFSNVPLPPAHHATYELSKQRESENIVHFNNLTLTGLTNNNNAQKLQFNTSTSPKEKTPSRKGYEKDIMVVLPVMPQNTGDGNLQMWYTQMPITAIIEDHTKPEVQNRADYDVYEDSKTEERHPYTNFLVNTASSKPSKSALDYGYPESFKFVEDLNGLPSNHKPEWASTDVDLDELPKSTTESEKHNPFEMFESVKPLEINKLLALQSVQIAADLEESGEKKNETESHIKTVPKRPTKRPTKKPQKTKTTTETHFQSSSTSTAMGVDQLYSAARTTLLESSSEFLPTLPPYKNKLALPLETATPTTTEFIPSTLSIVHTTTSTTPRTTTTTMPYTTTSTTTPHITTSTTPRSTTTTTTTTARSITSSMTKSSSTTTTTTTTTTSIPYINEIVVYNVTEDVDEEFQFDNFTAPGGNNFQLENESQTANDFNSVNLDFKPSEVEPFKELSPTLNSDMLTDDMKSMLISLGLLKSAEVSTTTIPSTTEKIFIKKELVTPLIDPNSYTSFKKIPIDFKQQNEKSAISDDMKDLLASFGLLPKKPIENTNSVTRISRQQNFNETNQTKEITPEEADLLDFFNGNSSNQNFDIDPSILSDEMKSTLESMGLLKESSRSPKSAHVFQPTSQLEKLNKDQNVKKINDVIKTIKSLSIKNESNDLSAEEIEKQLANITVTLNDENITDINDTLLFELNEVLTNDTKVKLITSTENTTTSKSPISNYLITSTNYSDTTVPTFPSDVNKSTEISPNPLSTEELLQLYELGKNEIKRQEPNETRPISTTNSAETTISIEDIPGANTEAFPASSESPNTTTSEIIPSSSEVTDTKVAENNNAPIADLAASFGGGDVASEEPSMDDLPTPKPNGLYFYLDWNTFLHVGEEDKNPIKIRFSPKAGNARNFIPITVP